jgi:hypothetical protein
VDGIPFTTPARTQRDLATCLDNEELAQPLAKALQRGTHHLRGVPGGHWRVTRPTRGWRDSQQL